MTTIQKITDIENEMARTQKNKATSYHLGLLKAKLAKLKQEIINPKSGGGGKPGEGFDVTVRIINTIRERNIIIQ